MGFKEKSKEELIEDISSDIMPPISKEAQSSKQVTVEKEGRSNFDKVLFKLLLKWQSIGVLIGCSLGLLLDVWIYFSDSFEYFTFESTVNGLFFVCLAGVVISLIGIIYSLFAEKYSLRVGLFIILVINLVLAIFSFGMAFNYAFA